MASSSPDSSPNSKSDCVGEPPIESQGISHKTNGPESTIPKPIDSSEVDRLLQNWQYAPEEVAARRVQGVDGRDLLLLRIDLGLLQLEVEGRPDGFRPKGFATYYDRLISQALALGDRFTLNDHHCKEIDREFVQFYHRRVAWLALRAFDKAIADANHTLALMDFSTIHAPCDEWIELHEQYRPFVLFHRTQAETLKCLADSDPERGLLVLTEGISHLCQVLSDLASYNSAAEDLVSGLERAELEDHQESFVIKLEELRRSIMAEYDLMSPLVDQLAAAIEGERYELAAELRDRITSGRGTA